MSRGRREEDSIIQGDTIVLGWEALLVQSLVGEGQGFDCTYSGTPDGHYCIYGSLGRPSRRRHIVHLFLVLKE